MRGLHLGLQLVETLVLAPWSATYSLIVERNSSSMEVGGVGLMSKAAVVETMVWRSRPISMDSREGWCHRLTISAKGS